jgi:hypothetical protein
MRYVATLFFYGALLLGLTPSLARVAADPTSDAPASTFAQSADKVEAYDFVEVTVTVPKPTAKNPFTDVTVTGRFTPVDGGNPLAAEGFCDSADGGTYRLRFMPSRPGQHSYKVSLRQGNAERTHTGTFEATDGKRRGVLRVDKEHPWHFVWEGTGEHYYFNGTTAFWLMGWQDESIIKAALDRLHRLKINRIRVLLSGTANIYWGEPVMTGKNFTMFLRPWVAAHPGSFDRPGNDFTRFDIAYWQKWERMLRYARDRDMIISAVVDISTHQTQPVAGSEDERRYFRYALARLSAFSNITWDLGDDLDSFRDEKWTHETGTFIHENEPYRHLATSHPVHPEHQDRGSAWFGFTSIQDWSRKQHELMLEQRQIQLKTGRILPQTNEEYGYEDHYPLWAPKPPGDSADVLRRTAWDIAMAGAYGTAGESARRGVNIWPDTGGGWVNGRGDDTMVMLQGYAHMVEFFTAFEWWKTDPHDELVSKGGYCVAEPGRCYAVYLPQGGKATVRLEEGRYRVNWFNPRSGETTALPAAAGPSWTSPAPPDSGDWALLLRKE